MKKFLLFLVLGIVTLCSYGQDYSLISEGVDNNGNYIVRVVVSTKKSPEKKAEDIIKHYAVKGVMFNGIAAAKGYSGQRALISDPNVEQTKKTWFDAFWDEGAYSRYATIVPSSLSVMKNKQTKMTETSALVTISVGALKKYLEENSIIQGFSDLW